ncbi:VOC family protein [Mucilaginibacter calamicampi]|uniref:VOC family protein n=1 Tax=Mucilaginibacter calamicampi TaxID=1302352 RepID=A0ABW2YWZ6_9SPHI
MFNSSKAFSGFSVDDIQKAKKFYEEVLGLQTESPMGMLAIKTNGNNNILVYPKPNHQPATFTVLNFPVDNIEKTVDALIAKGVTFEQYHFGEIDTDEKGIAHGEPKIAWFKDPAGNIISVIEEK